MPITLSLKIFAVGKLKDKTIESKCIEYCNKISHDARLSIIEIKDSDKNSEGTKLIAACNKCGGYTIALSEYGKEYASVPFAHRLESINRPVNFIIGGHHGLSDATLQCVDETIALSRMTFTHEFARLILIEQLYRAMSIINNRQYHREG